MEFETLILKIFHGCAKLSIQLKEEHKNDRLSKIQKGAFLYGFF
jgi:hypothetical protein